MRKLIPDVLRRRARRPDVRPVAGRGVLRRLRERAAIRRVGSPVGSGREQRPDRARRRRGVVAALTVAVLLSGGIAGAAWYGDHRVQQRDSAVRESIAAANTAAQAIFSYDYRTFDASVANGRSFVTGPFAKEYAQTTATLKAAAQKEQAVVRAEVSAAGVVTASPDRVELLLYVNQYRRNVNVVGEKVDQNRVTLTMVRVGRDWRVSAASAL
jgi:Mce-associated membrane protein